MIQQIALEHRRRYGYRRITAELHRRGVPVNRKRAIELNPGYATAHHWYASHLFVLDRYDQAIAEMKKAESLDPLSLISLTPIWRKRFSSCILMTNRYDRTAKRSKWTVLLPWRTINWAKLTSKNT